MKLSELVAYLNHLDGFDTAKSRAMINAAFDPIYHTITTHVLQFRDHTTELRQVCHDIRESLNRFDGVISGLKQGLRQDIENLEPHYFANSYQLYSEGMKNDSVDHMLQRRPVLGAAATDYLRSRMIRHSDWHYPGMILRPGLETWIQDLVALRI